MHAIFVTFKQLTFKHSDSLSNKTKTKFANLETLQSLQQILSRSRTFEVYHRKKGEKNRDEAKTAAFARPLKKPI